MGIYSEVIFPRINDFATKPFLRHRFRVLQSAHGRLLEIGFGSGLSLEHYPSTVTEIVGVEPNPAMIERAKARKDPRLKIVQGEAERLPGEDNEFDGVTSFFTLCTVGDFDAAVAEIKRVLKPGGKLFVIEHTEQTPGFTRKLQSTIKPLWKHLACGCDLDRNPIEGLRAAGFIFPELKTIGHAGFPNFIGPVYRGVGVMSRDDRPERSK